MTTLDESIIIPGIGTLQTVAQIALDRTFIEGTDNPDILFGTPGEDEIRAKDGDDFLIGTFGDDLLDGGNGFDTVDYSFLEEAITLLPRGAVAQGSLSGGQLISIERIVGASGRNNAIDGSTSIAGVSFNIDLGANQVTVNNIPAIGSQNFVVENFVNVTGTSSDDTIIGNEQGNILDGFSGNDFLIGGLGNDVLIGGDGDDILLGTTNALIATSQEQDVLIGGQGSDKFILGNASGSFYKFDGNDDFARIVDFSFGEQIQLGTGDAYSVQQSQVGFDIFVVTNGARDLIANVTVATAASRNALFADFSSVSLSDALLYGDFQLASGQSLGSFIGA